MARRSERRWTSVVLTLVAFVLTHQAVFLYTFGRGFDAALARTGHGTVWAATVVLVIALGTILAVIGAAELLRLASRASRLEQLGLVTTPLARDETIGALASDVVRTAVRIAVGVAVLLVLMENVEHALVGAALPGLSVFDGPDYQGSLPILLAFSLAVAVVRALYRWRRANLVARLRAVAVRLPRPEFRSGRRPIAARIARSTPLARRLAGRAPPAPAVA